MPELPELLVGGIRYEEKFEGADDDPENGTLYCRPERWTARILTAETIAEIFAD